MMRSRLTGGPAAIILALSIFMTGSVNVLRAADKENNDLRFEDARVVEVNERHISIIAETGVEHVIALNEKGTSVVVDGKKISTQEIKEGDVVTIVLDSRNPMKFARTIKVAPVSGDQLARNNR